MRKIISALALGVVAALMFAGNSALATQTKSGPQGSIGLGDFNVALCYHNDTAWSLSKDAQGQPIYTSPGIGTITWIVQAVKGNTTPNEFIMYGYLTVTNSGSGPCTLGNIVVNLQKQVPDCTGHSSGNIFVSAAADIANATAGDISGILGAQANIVAAGSQEDPTANGICGAGNYAVGANLPVNIPGVGTFYTTAGSVKLQFFNSEDNSAFALTDPNARNIPAGGIRTLLYKAYFNPVAAGISPGQAVRVEALVTFGNAGARGGSGASLPSVDINGDGCVSDCSGNSTCANYNDLVPCPEANVRTVPSRQSVVMPGLIACNTTVHLQDDGPELDPSIDPNTVTSTNAVWPTLDEVITNTTTETLSLSVSGGPSGGGVCNAATLQGVNCNGIDCLLSLTITTSNGLMTVQEPCCIGVNLSALSCVPVEATASSGPGSFCTFTQGGWGATPKGGNPGAILAANFDAVYGANGVTVGGTYTMTFKTASTVTITKHGKVSTTNTVTVTGAQAIDLYLPASKTPGQLTASMVNPDKSSSGVFGGQVLALQLNVDFSAAGIGPIGLGNLTYCGGDLPSIQGLTISQILAKANAVLGGATTASQGLYQQDGITPMTVSQLNDLIDNFNQGFDNCSVTGWVNQHLCGQ